MRPNNATDEYSTRLEQAKKDLNEKQTYLKTFSILSRTQQKRAAEDAVKAAKENLVNVQQAYDARWGRQVNKGGFPQTKRREIHQERLEKQLKEWGSDLEAVKSLAYSHADTASKKLHAVSVSNFTPKKDADIAKRLAEERNRHTLFSRTHNAKIKEGRERDAKLSDEQKRVIDEERKRRADAMKKGLSPSSLGWKEMERRRLAEKEERLQNLTDEKKQKLAERTRKLEEREAGWPLVELGAPRM